MVSLEEQPLVNSFNKVFLGAAGTSTGAPSDDEFNRTSFLSHFEGSNNGVNNAFDDGSTSNHTITAVGNVTQGSFGPFAKLEGEWGWFFDGNGDYVAVASTSDFAFGTADYTIEGFYFFTSINQYDNLWDFRLSGNTNHIDLYFDDSPLRIHVFAGGSDIITSSAATPIGEWVHIAVVCASGTTTLYQNGSSVGTSSTSIDYAAGGCRIGSRYTGTSTYATKGNISNFRVVKGTAVYTGNFTPSTSKLTAITNTKLLTCQSNRFVDNSASAHTVTQAGNAAVTSFGPFLTSAVYDPAVNMTSAYFDGSGDELSAPDSADWHMGSGLFTAECWVYPTASANQSIIMGQWRNPYAWVILFSNNTARYLRYVMFNGGFLDYTSSTSVPLNAWSHIALSRASGNVFSLYLNGVRVHTVTNNITISDVNSTMRIGGQGTENFWKGYITDARVVKGTAVYSGASYTTPTAPLTAITNTKLLLNMANGQAIDSAAQTNLTLYGNANTSTDQAKFGNTSLHLDGTGDYVNVFPASRGLIYNWTIEQWIYPTRGYAANGQQFDRIWGNGQVLNSSVQLHFDDTTAPKIVLRLNDNVIWTSSVSISLNAWTHVAAVCDANGTRLYIAGTERATTSTVVNLAAKNFNIGTSITTNGFFQGFMDDFRISDFARYTGNFTAPSAAFEDKGQ